MKNTFHIKYNSKMYYREVMEISNCSWKYELFAFNPLGGEIANKHILMFFVVPISLQLKLFSKKTFHSAASFPVLFIRTNSVWVSISTYVNNGTTKVPISAKIGFRVQGSTSEVWNYPVESPLPLPFWYVYLHFCSSFLGRLLGCQQLILPRLPLCQSCMTAWGHHLTQL